MSSAAAIPKDGGDLFGGDDDGSSAGEDEWGGDDWQADVSTVLAAAGGRLSEGGDIACDQRNVWPEGFPAADPAPSSCGPGERGPGAQGSSCINDVRREFLICGLVDHLQWAASSIF